MTAIDETLVRRLVASQFPEWKDLSVRPVAMSGWDNRIFRLGEEMVVRIPSALEYAVQVEKEHRWLPRLAPNLPLSIPKPLAMGEPGDGYPYRWSIYRWLEGEPAASAPIADLRQFAISLAQFLIDLQQIDPEDGPLPGPQNFYRGGELAHYDTEMRRALATLKDRIDTDAATDVWESALATTWSASPVWVHGDVSAGNLLVQGGRLSSIIDFGMLAVGDPACDLAIAWTFFQGESREAFQEALLLNDETWARGRGWVLWKACIIAAGFTGTNAIEAAHPWRVIDEVLSDHRRKN